MGRSEDQHSDFPMSKRVVVPQHVVYRALAHETVLLNIRTSTYHSVDTVGARFLEVLVEAESVGAAADVLALEYEQPRERIASDLKRFCDELADRELVRLEPAND